MLRKVSFFILSISLMASLAIASDPREIEAATKPWKVAFILVYDPAAQQIDQARQVISEAMKRVPGSVKIELDRSAKINSEIVTKLKLSGAPVPLILVESSTGGITGGVSLQQVRVTPELLVKMVPSPKKVEIIKAISEGHAVLITASRKNMKSLKSVNDACAAACQQMTGKLVHIKIDMADKAEESFLTDLRLDMASTEPVTLVANVQGQISGSYTGPLQAGDLVLAATKKIGGCCPSTMSNPKPSCDPVKK
jgi:hypothetical protein